MNKGKPTGRWFKKKVLDLLKEKNFKKGIGGILRLPPMKAVNPLFSFLYNLDENVKWRSISAMGVVVSEMANQNMESARIVMRRLIWNLNDESGGIGWGSPEAMGEIMARNRKLAEEYSKILVSYIRPSMNFIENEELQKGVLWGIGRITYAYPKMLEYSIDSIVPFLESEVPVLRGLAVLAVTPFNTTIIYHLLNNLRKDETVVRIYFEEELKEYTIGELSKIALGNI